MVQMTEQGSIAATSLDASKRLKGLMTLCSWRVGWRSLLLRGYDEPAEVEDLISDNDATYVDPQDMLAELRDDNVILSAAMRQVHAVCDEYHDVATSSLLEVWIDETERRSWFLYEASHRSPS
jgi:hypothetical protein